MISPSGFHKGVIPNIDFSDTEFNAQQEKSLSALNALPDAEVTKQIPITDEQRKGLQNKLDEYTISLNEAVNLSSTMDGVSNSLSALYETFCHRIPWTSRRFPVLPLVLSHYLGLNKTIGAYGGVMVAGFIYGKAKSAAEMAEKTPEQYIEERKVKCTEQIDTNQNNILEARNNLLRAQVELQQVGFAIGIPVNDVFSDTFIQALVNALEETNALTLPPAAKYITDKLEAQRSRVAEIELKMMDLKHEKNKGNDVELSLLHQELKLGIEADALKVLEDWRCSVESQPITGRNAHIQLQQNISTSMSSNSALNKALKAHKSLEEAKAKIDSSNTKILEALRDLNKLLSDEQLVKEAIKAGVTSSK